MSSSSWAWLLGRPDEIVRLSWEVEGRAIPGAVDAVQSTILPSGDRLFVRDGGLEGAPGGYASGGGVTPWMMLLGSGDSMWKATWLAMAGGRLWMTVRTYASIVIGTVAVGRKHGVIPGGLVLLSELRQLSRYSIHQVRQGLVRFPDYRSTA